MHLFYKSSFFYVDELWFRRSTGLLPWPFINIFFFYTSMFLFEELKKTLDSISFMKLFTPGQNQPGHSPGSSIHDCPHLSFTTAVHTLIFTCLVLFNWADRQQPDSLPPKKLLCLRVAELKVWLPCGSWFGLDLHDVCMRCASSS